MGFYMNENVDKIKIRIKKEGKLVADGAWYNLIDGVASTSTSLRDVVKWLKSFEFKKAPPLCILEIWTEDVETPESFELDYLDLLRYFDNWLKDAKKREPYNVSVYGLYPTNRGSVGYAWKATKYKVKELAFEETINFVGYKATLYCFTHEVKNIGTGEYDDKYLLLFGFKGKGNNYYPVLAPSILARNQDSVESAYKVLNQLKNRDNECLTSYVPGCLKDAYPKDKHEYIASLYLKILSLTPKTDRLIKDCMGEALRGKITSLGNYISIVTGGKS